MIDHDLLSYQAISRLFVDGTPYGAMTRDDVLDNITLSWLTTTGIPGTSLLGKQVALLQSERRLHVGVSLFPDEIDAAPRSWVQRAYPKLIHYNQLDAGEFAAWEQPTLLVEEPRAGFRPLRT